jgi:hypothetical protein
MTGKQEDNARRVRGQKVLDAMKRGMKAEDQVGGVVVRGPRKIAADIRARVERLSSRRA